jgi:hypothetical protein
MYSLARLALAQNTFIPEMLLIGDVRFDVVLARVSRVTVTGMPGMELMMMNSCLLVVSGCGPYWVRAKNDPACI